MSVKFLQMMEKHYVKSTRNIFRHYKVLERIVYKRDKLKKRTKLENTLLFRTPGQGQMEWVDKYLNSYNTMHKVGNYPKEKYSHLLQMFTDNHLELKVKYRYYNFLPEKLYIIFRVHPREFCSKCKPHVDDCNELPKRISRIIECSRDKTTDIPIYTDCT
jgi:hypothetical protein